MESNSGEAVKTAVLRGMGIGILMQAHLDNEVRKREVKILKIRNLKDMWVSSFVIYKKDRTLSDNARMFLDTLKQRAETREGSKEGKRTRDAGRAA
jgi:DNA-binding transcriptional LysR family regulator